MRRVKTLTFMAIVSAAFVTLSGAYWQWRLLPLKRVHVQQTDVPTVFVAGDYAKAFSTNGFVNRLSHAHLMTRSLMVNVSKAGHVKINQHAPLRHNPTIQVVFADNHHPNRQAKQLATVMHLLHSRYHVTTFNAVGHSSGGNIIMTYLTAHHRQSQPNIRRFVSIGTNYPGIQNQLKRLPTTLKTLNIAGQIWHTRGDGEVQLAGVLAFSKQLTQHHLAVTTRVVHGSPIRAQHSMLHINPTVDAQLVTFLYGQTS